MSILRKSRITHEEMIIKTINAPINLYFDKTPSGKILNRYSRDLNKVDTQIGKNILWGVESYVCAWFDIYVASLNSSWVLCIVPIVLTACGLWMKYYLKTYRELSRLQSVTGSPLISHLGETLNGATTIRAFNKQKDFIDTNTEYLNHKMNITFWKDAVKRWFSLRITFTTIFIFAFTATFWVVFKSQTDPVLMGMLFIHFLWFGVEILWGSMTLTELDANMVSYAR